jgi:hypothetical protein
MTGGQSFLRRAAAKVGRLLPLSMSRRSRAMLLHEGLASGPVPDHGFVPDPERCDADLVIAGRALVAYRAARAGAGGSVTGSADDVWTAFHARQQDFTSVLESGRAGALATYLCAMDRMDATHGITAGHVMYRELRQSGFARAKMARLILDKLLALAEAVGAVPLENPEQGSWGGNEAMHAGHLADAIEEKLALAFRPPVVAGGALALRAGDRLILDRDVMSLYAAWRARQILGNKSGSRIAEIGAGVGRAAYWYGRLDANAEYWIFDLPHVNVLQAFYLAKADPEFPLRLFGEAPLRAGGFSVMPHFEIENTRSAPFDLVLNQDSFPEINEAAVTRYLEWMHATKSRYFLSINHESRPETPGGGRQLRIADTIKKVGGFTLVSRHAFPLRRGYAEELYEVRPA